MNLYLFKALPYERQIATVFDLGTFLMWRWEEETAIGLYELPGRFFVELQFDTATNSIVGLHTFRNVGPLEDYAAAVVLPEL